VAKACGQAAKHDQNKADREGAHAVIVNGLMLAWCSRVNGSGTSGTVLLKQSLADLT
jgi:hypothetical protein